MNCLFLVWVAYGFVAVISLIRPVSFDNCSITNFSRVCKFRIIHTTPPFHSAMHNSQHHYSRSTQWIIINAKNKYSSGMKFWYSRWLLTALYLSLSLQQRYLSLEQVTSSFLPISVFFLSTPHKFWRNSGLISGCFVWWWEGHGVYSTYQHRLWFRLPSKDLGKMKRLNTQYENRWQENFQRSVMRDEVNLVILGGVAHCDPLDSIWIYRNFYKAKL